MLIYRDQRSRAHSEDLLHCLRARVNHLGRQIHSEIILDILIQAGTLESALTDALFPEFDGIDPVAGALREVSTAAGHMLWHSWHGRPEPTLAWCTPLLRALDRVETRQLPRSVEISVPEGYAYYGLYPEMYLEAAKDFAKGLTPGEAVCLGLRTIGSSLSAVVTAALEELGWSLASWTLRPQGHPFSRRPRLTPELAQALRSKQRVQFLVVDEGPGISGSSFAGTAATLRELGVPPDQIVLFPSWVTDGKQLRSPLARESWSRHRQVSRSFETVWLESGRLNRVFPGDLTDLSAGRWRDQLYRSRACHPAVQPQHERRKYLLRSPPDPNHPATLLKFVGLGSRSDANARRAERLADAGFAPRPLKLAHGFLAMRFVEGRPLSSGDDGSAFLARVAEYLSFLALEYRAEPSTGEPALREMITVNLSEGLGQRELERINRRLPDTWTELPVALDARMQPHEWLRTPDGFVKTDGVDHHADHFLPGCQDIAWDVAGAALELGLGEESRRFLITRYRQLSGDSTISSRLPHYAVAYLAFRLGYATLAQEVLGETSDESERFRREADRCRLLLSGDSSMGSEYWDV
jgi:hypothetical protein